MDPKTRRTAEELQQWAKLMCFNPGDKEFPSVETFQKICKGKTIKMWQDIMNQVRRKEDVLHIQKNLLLQRLRSGKPLDLNPVPGHLSQQVVLASKIAVKQKERNAIAESFQKVAVSIKSKEKVLRKSGHKIVDLESKIQEFKKKQLMFKIKTKECRITLNYFNSISSALTNLCPPPPNAKPSSAMPTYTAEAALYKCIELVRDLRFQQDDLPGSDDKTAHLKHMWNQVKSLVSGWGAQQLWDAMNMYLLAGLLEEITSLCDGDKMLRLAESRASTVSNALAILPAKHTASVFENIKLDTITKIKAKNLQTLQQKLVQTLEVSKFNSSQVDGTVLNSSNLFKAWVEAQSNKTQLSAKLLAIKAEIAHFKESTPVKLANRDLMAAKEELAKLEFQMYQDKKQIEQNLGHMRNVPDRLQVARTKALEDRRNFTSKLPLFLKSKPNQLDSEFDFCSPERKLPLSSTMIGNVTADSNLSFETTCDSISDKVGGQSNLSELVLAVRESISKEAKLFIKVCLRNMPFIIRNGTREPVCNLLVHALRMSSHSSSIPQKNFLHVIQGTPFSSVPQIVLSQFHALSHIAAIHLFKLLNERTHFVDPQAVGNLEALKKLTPQQEANLQEKIECTNTFLEGIDSSLSKVKINLDCWVERPVQGAVSSLNLVVGGLTFDEWCNKLDLPKK